MLVLFSQADIGQHALYINQTYIDRLFFLQLFGASGFRSHELGSFENVPGKQHGSKLSVQTIYEVKVVTGETGSSKLLVICHW